MKNKCAVLLMSFTIVCVLSNCGVKPTNVDAPTGYEDITFPKEYPTKEEK